MHQHAFDLAGVCTGPGPCDTTSSNRSPKENWVDKTGGLPLYIRAIMHALMRSGHSRSRAISLAVGTVKRWARGGGDVTPATRARAAAALAEWEAKKARAHSMSAPVQGDIIDLAGLTYEWKHGWIPITPRAALQKAHGSHKGAAKLLHANGPHKPGTGSSSAPKPSAPKSGIRIEHTGDGTLVHGTSRGGPETAALKANGFKFSSNLGAWYLPRNWGHGTREQKVYQLEKALKDKGIDHHVERGSAGRTTTAAERAAQQQERSASRAERLDAKAEKLRAESKQRLNRADALSDMIPMGQPILVGHHSEGRHRRTLARIHSDMDKGVAAHKEAESAAQRAEAARKAAAGREDPGKIQRRIAKNEADLRGVERALNGQKYGNVTPEHRAKLEAARAELKDTIDFDKSRLAEAQKNGAKVFTKADVSPGDAVKIHGSWYRVKRANAKTVTIPSIVGGSWTDTAPYSEITEVRRGTSLSAPVEGSVDLAARTDLLRRAAVAHKSGKLTPKQRQMLATYLKRVRKPSKADMAVALPGGRFPIPDRAHLHKAIRAYGRAKPSDKPKVKRHIIRRARSMGLGHALPDHWKG